MTAPRAARWVRVSSGEQDEAAQEPAIDKLIADEGWTDTQILYRLHDRSAYKGEQAQALAKALADAQAGRYDVLVCWHSSRLDRRGPKHAYAFLAAIEQAGAKVASVREKDFGSDDFSAEVATSLRMSLAKEESRLKSANVTKTFAAMDAGGYFRGRPPRGYVVIGERRAKHLVPNEGDHLDAAKMTAIAASEAFTRVATGESTPSVVKDMRARGYQCGETGIARMVHSDFYWTGEYVTHRADGTAYAYRTVPLVPRELAMKARASLAANRSITDYSGRVAPLTGESYSGALRCGACGGVLYRQGQDKKLKDGSSRSYGYYRHKAAGCASKLRTAEVDALVDGFFAGLDVPIVETVQHPGTGRARAAEIARELRALDIDASDYEDRHAALMAERRRLKAGAEGPWTEKRILRGGNGEIVTYAARWASWSRAERTRALRDETPLYLAAGPKLVPAPGDEVIRLGGNQLKTEWTLAELGTAEEDRPRHFAPPAEPRSGCPQVRTSPGRAHPAVTPRQAVGRSPLT
jgi:DNA invertase Pin-like site-specific DNA recombinase